MRYHRGTTRYQQSFLSIDDQINKSNVVRIIDEICEEFCAGVTLDKGQEETGRKAYHPADLLKILVYGYFNGISSSRKLERETHRNIEMRWLTSQLTPDHKTISDFRKDNPSLVRGLFKHLIVKFDQQGLPLGKSISVDGSKVKGYASTEITLETVKQKLSGIEVQVEKYLQDMDILDKMEDEVEELVLQKAKLEAELEQLALKKKEYQNLEKQLHETAQNKVCITDADARMMQGRGGKYWGYNVQTAVDNDHHVITSIEVTNHQNDKGLLAPIVKASEETTGQKPAESIADAGYYKVVQIEALEQNGITCYVGINRTPSQARDQLQGLTFTYQKQEDQYTCNEHKALPYRRTKKLQDGRPVKVYQGKECNVCSIRNKCTTSEYRHVHRHENQSWIDSFHKRMESQQGKEKLLTRSNVAEHPFGTMKYYMGQMPLLLRGKEKVQTEMNLYALGYNLKRYSKLITTENKNATNKTTMAA